jgi:penicillin-binding protein 1A
VWGDFFREIHRGLPRKNFPRPSSGIIDVTVCAKSGLLRTEACNEGAVTLPFLEGTQPGLYCDLHDRTSFFQTRIPITSMQFDSFDNLDFFDSLPMPQLPLDLLPELQSNQQGRTQQGRTTTTTTTTTRNTQPPARNPLLDDEPPRNTPRNNSPNSTPANTPAVFPDTAVQFVPNREDELEDEDTGLDLPSWNPLR